jgi:polyisoprenoid-binding protein YceI
MIRPSTWRDSLLAAALLLLPVPARAGEQRLLLEPATTRVTFTLGATLHTAEGSIRLDRGELRFDPETGAVSGEIVLDAKSAETGSESRDANMRRDVLESERFPYVRFRPEKLEVLRRDDTTAEVRLVGGLELHGESRPFTIPAQLVRKGDRMAISSSFRVPYVDWNVRDYSNFVLRVDRFVDVTVEADGKLAAP